MSKMKIDYVLDLGGSIVNPGSLKAPFLKALRELIVKYIKKGNSFAIVVGGGAPARLYQHFLREHFEARDDDLDLMGIRFTMVNAELVRITLSPYSYPLVLETPHLPLREVHRYPIFVFSGWRGKTGRTTDYMAVCIAKNLGLKEVISLSNIKGVYPLKDGELERGTIIPRLSWEMYEKMVGKKWVPGLRAPFDPAATREAKKARLTVRIGEGANLANLQNYLEGKEFVGTIIE